MWTRLNYYQSGLLENANIIVVIFQTAVLHLGFGVIGSSDMWQLCWIDVLWELEVCHPRCVCENRKGCVVKHSYVN